MVKLPIFSGKELVRALGKFGYELDHQTGSHIILRYVKPPFRRLTIPRHKEVAKGMLRSILRQAGISKEELIANLQNRKRVSFIEGPIHTEIFDSQIPPVSTGGI